MPAVTECSLTIRKFRADPTDNRQPISTPRRRQEAHARGPQRCARDADAATGDPYCSLVNVATDVDGSPILLISQLAIHTKNILADPRVSLMLDERKEGDPLQGARVMLMGRPSNR